MAIVKLKKLTFCGLMEDKAAVLEQLQNLGGLHLISLTDATHAVGPSNQQQAEQVIQALKYLNACARKRLQVKNDKLFNLDEIVDQVLTLKNKTRELRDRYDALQKRIKELEPWGDFKFPASDQFAEQRLWFYIIPKRMMNQLNSCDYVWQTVFQNNLFCYVVVISETEPPENAFPVARTHTGALPLSELENQAGELELTLEELQAQRESLTRWIGLIKRHFNEILNRDDLRKANTLTRDEAGVFVIQGWLPENLTGRYRKFAEQQGLAFLAEDPAEHDKPPTLLRNPAPLSGGEDLVGFYQTPSYYGWDPSLVVFFSFSLFFALILSDAGYAGVFAVILALKWRRLGTHVKGRRIRILAANTIFLSILWGMLCGSYFGYAPTAGSLFSPFKVFDLNDFQSMMRLTIAIGVGHLALANSIKAIQRLPSVRALGSIGWIGLAVGGFCYWLSMDLPGSPLNTAGRILLITGAALLVLFNGERRLSRWTDLPVRLFEGAKSLISITQLFGDILSYMRLFALGLASASLALTFNHLAEQIYHNLPGPGLFFSILIFLLGHALNLLLCILSGLVHGLRLNFIEFYNWSVSDEGYPFKAFSKRGVH